MTSKQAADLRAPFPESVIGKLPKLTCKKCSESATKVCAEHKKQRCQACGNYISTAHIDLDYVGHAATSDRLLKVDPDWTWKPMAVGPNGEPLITNGGMWIELTVCGVTRPGFGDGKNPKEIIGDAIRNAAMRFGVALDLWAKEDLSSASNGAGTDHSSSSGEPSGDASPPQAGAAADEPASPLDDPAAGTPFQYDIDAPVEPPGENTRKPPTAAMLKKLNVLVGKLRPDHVSTLQLWQSMGREPVVSEDGTLHWSPLRDSLNWQEAHDLIDRLDKFAVDKLGAAA